MATAQAGDDDEMRRKVERHRSSRPRHWQTVEEPLQLAETIARYGPNCDLMIIDCLTFFAANLLDAQGDEQSADRGALHGPPSRLPARSCWCRMRWAVAWCPHIRRAGVSVICWAK